MIGILEDWKTGRLESLILFSQEYPFFQRSAIGRDKEMFARSKSFGQAYGTLIHNSIIPHVIL